MCRGSTSPLATHVLPLLGPNDIIKLQGESPVRMGLKKRTQDYARGHTPSVGGPHKEDNPRKVSKSDSPSCGVYI